MVRGSNSRPSVCKTDALPTELTIRIKQSKWISLKSFKTAELYVLYTILLWFVKLFCWPYPAEYLNNQWGFIRIMHNQDFFQLSHLRYFKSLLCEILNLWNSFYQAENNAGKSTGRLRTKGDEHAASNWWTKMHRLRSLRGYLPSAGFFP